ncbi:hypothetical protein JCM18899A_23720 [Nocardioides sp. AN3]
MLSGYCAAEGDCEVEEAMGESFRGGPVGAGAPRAVDEQPAQALMPPYSRATSTSSPFVPGVEWCRCGAFPVESGPEGRWVGGGRAQRCSSARARASAIAAERVARLNEPK